MKLSYDWLKKYIDFDYSPSELADKLTNLGIEVEEIYTLIPEFSGVVIGHVKSVNKHPDADKLSVCTVSDGEEDFQVICGAPNVAEGQLIPFAKVDAMLPNGMKIRKAKIRGVVSFGMICSKQELGLEAASEGIWPLDDSFTTGEDFYSVLAKKQDHILDLFITPNRPDCMSIVGIAREISAVTGNKLRLPEINLNENSALKTANLVSINIQSTDGCPRYAARVIKNVKIDESPDWIKEKLQAVGVRSINNVVDITNYVLMELGHPLHAFDLDNIKGSEINVRFSKPREKFVTLDEKERELPEKTVLICDQTKAVAIGGIMGGLNSEVSDSTVNILLESAYFNPVRISASSKKLGLGTEASQRFERGADPNGVLQALNRAAALISDIAGGDIARGIVDVYPEPVEKQEVHFRPERVNRLLGSNLENAVIIEKLESLGIVYSQNKAVIPTFRVDLQREVDLIEEVARLVSYENLPVNITTEIPYETDEFTSENLISQMRANLIELGLNESFSNSMLPSDEVQPFSQGENVTILNPISDDMTTMRPALLPGLLKAVAYNQNRNISDIRLFEIGRVFRNYKKDRLPDQPKTIAGVISGKRFPQTWNSSKELVDFYDIKGIAESFLAKIFLDNFHIILYDKYAYMLGQETIAFLFKEQIFGYCGRVDDQIIKSFGINNPVYAFEFDVDLIVGNLKTSKKYAPVPKFPYIEVDMALVMGEEIGSADVIKFVSETGRPLLNHVEVFDVYRGDKLPEAQKSLAIRMRFQSPKRTLSDNEVDKIFRKIISESELKFNAKLRK
ncbi:MAG: phenylalanine--tRNA ligase subunit beta [Calditrichaceae bacterium]